MYLIAEVKEGKFPQG